MWFDAFSACTSIILRHILSLLQALGQIGRVIKVNPLFTTVEVEANGTKFVYNPKCLLPAPGKITPELSVTTGTSNMNVYLPNTVWPKYWQE